MAKEGKAQSSEELLAKWEAWADRLAQGSSPEEKLSLLVDESQLLSSFFQAHPAWHLHWQKSSPSNRYLLAALIAIGQGSVVLGVQPPSSPSSLVAYEQLLAHLSAVDRYYDQWGGLIGYHFTFCRHLLLQQLHKQPLALEQPLFSPPTVDLCSDRSLWTRYLLAGIDQFCQLAEFYPIGGAAERLQWRDEESGKLQPAALLPFLGRTLLEGMMRDLQSREHLYYKLTGRQHRLPVAMMVSADRDHQKQIEQLCRECHFFGRTSEELFFFEQPLVPVIDAEGHWQLEAPLQLLMKPGGHGALWKCAMDAGLLDKLEKKGCHHLFVRQVNNPLANHEALPTAFCGAAMALGKPFGFVACHSLPATAEGRLALQYHHRQGYLVTNVEYALLGEESQERYPLANTNLLFGSIAQVRQAVAKLAHPGLLVNLKSRLESPPGSGHYLAAGRLETTMQGLSDLFIAPSDKAPDQLLTQDLATLVVLAPREKVFSVTKRCWKPGEPLLESTEGCYYDLLCYYHFLFSYCGFSMPPLVSAVDYLQNQWSWLGYLHPALGLTQEILAQKLQGGSIAPGSDCELEIAELSIRDLQLEGSLVIEAEQPLGRSSDPSRGLVYNEEVGRCLLDQVRISNKGIDKESRCEPWRRQLTRKEALQIYLEGNGEFVARDVHFVGSHTFRVAQGEKLTVTQAPNGLLHLHRELKRQPSWFWRYSRHEETIQLDRID